MNAVNPTIEWKTVEGRSCLYLTFSGKFTYSDGVPAVKKMTGELNSRPGKSTLIFNCLDMEGYDNKGRIAWQHAMTGLKDRISDVWVITDSSLIRVGVNVLKVFTKFDIEVVKKEEEIKF
ncbi:MAG: hypothetical protein JXJ19_08575 [Elusimicrobia bacterium]|nr:hypothetical protein [Elusimicrobiota bacterium]